MPLFTGVFKTYDKLNNVVQGERAWHARSQIL